MKSFLSYFTIALIAGVSLLLINAPSLAAITIPNEINAETLGTAVLNAAAPTVSAVIIFSMGLFLIGVVIGVIYRRIRRIAH